jgi:L-2-hydroxyglutarate oxidase LhgO
MRASMTLLAAGPGKEARDFYIKRDAPGWVNCFGIESPGLSASLAIGEYIAQLVRD